MKNLNFKKGFTRTPKFGVTPKRAGFTLIELLVVVAIIGILASVVMTSVNTARTKATDAAIKSNLNTVRGESEIFSSDNANTFLPSGGSTFTIADCPTYNGSGTDMLSVDKAIADAIAQAIVRGGNGSSCYNSSGGWAVAVGFKSDPNTSWCVDSSGIAKSVASAPGSAINGTTFLCN